MEGENETTFHRLVPHPGNVKRSCVYCKQMGLRFACGVAKTSYYRCDECQVSLCRLSVSDCFYRWHEAFKKSTWCGEWRVLGFVSLRKTITDLNSWWNSSFLCDLLKLSQMHVQPLYFFSNGLITNLIISLTGRNWKLNLFWYFSQTCATESI